MSAHTLCTQPFFPLDLCNQIFSADWITNTKVTLSSLNLFLNHRSQYTHFTPFSSVFCFLCENLDKRDDVLLHLAICTWQLFFCIANRQKIQLLNHFLGALHALLTLCNTTIRSESKFQRVCFLHPTSWVKLPAHSRHKKHHRCAFWIKCALGESQKNKPK